MKELVFSRTLLPALQRNAARTGFVDAGSGRTTTFGEHLDRVSRLAGALAGLGVGPGDRVAVLGANSVAYCELWHACLLGAAVINPLNSRFSADELAFVLTDSGSTILFVDAAFAGTIAGIRSRTSLRHVVLVGDGEGPCDVRYEDLLAGSDAALPAEPEEDDPAVLIYTGGTTGRPKGVVLSQRAEVLNQYHFALQGLWSGNDKPYLIQTPMFHGATMLGIVGAAMFGTPAVVLGAFEPGASLDATSKFGCGSTVLIPTMIAMVLNHPTYEPSRLASLDWMVFGGSPIPTPVLAKLVSDLPQTKILQGYGMTEGCTINTIMTDADSRGGHRTGSAGRALTGVSVVAQAEDGTVLPAGEVGEICVRGGQFLTEYWGRPEETSAALRDGWYHSGDVGYVDEAGYLFLVDRAKDMIISGGENVYSSEVENALASHQAVLQVAVIGIPHDLWGETVHAVVVLRPGVDAAPDELIAHARLTIAGYKVPRSVELRTDPLPLSAAGKVLKRELREPHWAGRSSNIS